MKGTTSTLGAGAVVSLGPVPFTQILLEELVASGRAFADVHHLLGLCRSLLGQHERALEEFDRALTLNPRYIEAHIHRGIALSELGRVEEADAAFRQAA